jgi:serine/threonine protein kinase
VDQTPIGKGRFGVVYRAYDPINKKTVAIKRTKRIKVSKREAFIMKQFGYSKYFPVFYDFIISNNNAYIVMEYIKGEPLGKNFQTPVKKMDEKTSVQIAINVLKGLIQLHKLGYTHNDISPKNIILMDHLPSRVKIIDFNICKKIKKNNSIQSDIKRTALLCLLLINGSTPQQVEISKVQNRGIRLVLLKALYPSRKNYYRSAEEFLRALMLFHFDRT